MSGPEMQAIRVLITPHFNSIHRAISLSIALCIESPQLQAGSALVLLPSIIKKAPLGSQIKDIQAFDDEGQLPIVPKDNDGKAVTIWEVEKATSGDVKLLYDVFPLASDDTISAASPLDLRCEQGGLLGSGLMFIPIPPTDKVCRNIVEWDLSKAPGGTRAVWTFGEGPGPVEKVGHASTLSDSVYMVGPIHSNPPVPIPGSISDYYGYYWFGDLPSNIAVIKDIHHDFFLKVSDFFRDSPSASNPYRTFVRNTTPAKSFGGTGFTRSQIFDYDDRISQAQDYDLVRRMSHEMTKNWLGPSVTDEGVDWLYEGIKNTLSIYLPFRTGFRTNHYFQATMSMLCMKYYTNPLIHLSQDEALKLAPTNPYAKELLSARVWAFVIGTDYRARIIAESNRRPEMMRPIEDLAIKPLAVKMRNGRSHGINEWIELLQPLMGDEARERYEYMITGSVIFLPEKFFGSKTHRMKATQQEILDFGMDRQSFEVGLVKGLKHGSRAEEAGLKEGDKIVWSSYSWKCVDDFAATMEVHVERAGVETRVIYWPRSFEKVETLQFVKIEEP